MLHLSSTFLDAIEVPTDGTRPQRTTGGVAFVLGASNVMGSYTQFLNGATDWPAGFGDGWGIYLEIGNTSAAAQAHSCLFTIGIDLAGGTSYTDFIVHLAGTPSTNDKYAAFWFPVRIPNGASLAIKGQDSSATPLANSYVRCTIPGKPTRPELVRVGTFVRTFGADTANSRGTLLGLTGGGASEGPWTQIGGAALAEELWHWDIGVAAASGTLGNGLMHIDVAVGDASNKRRVVHNARAHTNSAEALGKTPPPFASNKGSNGENLYARIQLASTSSTSFYVTVHGVGGAAECDEGCSFLGMIEAPADTTQPTATSGIAFTPGASNTYGSYVQVVDGSTAWASDDTDGCGIWICVYGANVSGQAHPLIVTLGIDLAGGTSYTDWIQHLLCTDAAGIEGGGVQYWFPVRVPKGASIAVKGQESHATPGTPRIQIKIPTKPTRPELLRLGTFVQTFGVDTATTAGEAFTPGTTSEGAYVQIGGAALDKDIWYWDYGISTTATAVSATGFYTDLAVGDASNKRRVIRNARIWGDTTEALIKQLGGEYGQAMVGDLVYGRCQVGDNGAPSGMSIAAYGVGG